MYYFVNFVTIFPILQTRQKAKEILNAGKDVKLKKKAISK